MKSSLVHEFELINTWFADQSAARADVHLGIGDDAALILLGDDQELITACACAMAVGAAHERSTAPGPTAIAEPEQVAASCYDEAREALLAQHATPAWAVLCLSLEQADCDWLERFSSCLHACMRRHEVQLIGGDTTRGPTQATLFLSGYRSAPAT